MAKVAIKSDKMTPYGGIFYAMEVFNSLGLGEVIDKCLGVRSTLIGYQYSEIIGSIFNTFLCGGDHLEDITTKLGSDLRMMPGSRVPSSDTLARGLKELAGDGKILKSESGAEYVHDYNAKLNALLVTLVMTMGLLRPGQSIDLDYDNEFTPAEKKDAVFSYKKRRGYFPGVMTCGPLILGIENRQGNSNVKFGQVEAILKMMENLREHGLGVRMFRADCGSFIKELVEQLLFHTEVFYLRASNCQSRMSKYADCDSWRATKVNGCDMEVASFEFDEFLRDYHLRLVVQRTRVEEENGQLCIEGMERYVYRAILTSDHESTEEKVIGTYNARGASERNFDQQNNDFGWAHLPFSKLQQNTVFLLVMAMLKNFFVLLLKLVSRIFPMIDETCRLKRFVYAFISIPAKWVKVGREWVLNIYTKDRWLHYWSIFNHK